MPSYSADSADMAVVRSAYGVASQLTSDPKILLSLFEAGLVESNFHNAMVATDHDSLGYLQQRPSQGWPTPTDIATATRSYISRAKANSSAHPSYTPGQLAQSVQRSAYPERYDQAAGAATTLLARVRGGPLGGFDPNPTIPIPGLTAPGANPVDAIAEAIRGMAAPLAAGGRLADQLFKIFMPSNFVRLVAGVAGGLCVAYGCYLLSREVR